MGDLEAKMAMVWVEVGEVERVKDWGGGCGVPELGHGALQEVELLG